MHITIDFDRTQIDAVVQRLHGIKVGVPKVLAAAVNDTAKQEKTQISAAIREKVNIKKKDIDPSITFTRATPDNPGSVLTLAKSKRLPLKYFGARQNARGVTYQIDKNGGRVLREHAFIVKSLGGHVFLRKGDPRPAKKGRYAGKMRQAIIKLFGPSPWGVFIKAGLEKITVTNCRDLLRKSLDRRVKFELLKKSGAIKGGN